MKRSIPPIVLRIIIYLYCNQTMYNNGGHILLYLCNMQLQLQPFFKQCSSKLRDRISFPRSSFYSCSVWSIFKNIDGTRLEKVQRRAARLTRKYKYRQCLGNVTEFRVAYSRSTLKGSFWQTVEQGLITFSKLLMFELTVSHLDPYFFQQKIISGTASYIGTDSGS